MTLPDKLGTTNDEERRESGEQCVVRYCTCVDIPKVRDHVRTLIIVVTERGVRHGTVAKPSTNKALAQ